MKKEDEKLLKDLKQQKKETYNEYLKLRKEIEKELEKRIIEDLVSLELYYRRSRGEPVKYIYEKMNPSKEDFKLEFKYKNIIISKDSKTKVKSKEKVKG